MIATCPICGRDFRPISSPWCSVGCMAAAHRDPAPEPAEPVTVGRLARVGAQQPNPQRQPLGRGLAMEDWPMRARYRQAATRRLCSPTACVRARDISLRAMLHHGREADYWRAEAALRPPPGGEPHATVGSVMRSLAATRTAWRDGWAAAWRYWAGLQDTIGAQGPGWWRMSR